MRRHSLLSIAATIVAACASACGSSGANDDPGDASALGFGSSSGGSGGAAGSFGTSSGGSGYHGDGGPCVNLQCAQVDCSAQGKPADATMVSGTVYDPAGRNPLYNAIVYIPNEPVKPFTSGVVCDQCGVLTTGNPVVSALSDPTGHFVLRNAPPGRNIPLVVQVGKWRRQTTLAAVEACTDNPIVDRNLTRLPANQSEGDMPLVALATGGCDAFECLLRKIGVADSEFTAASGSGRIHVYQGLNGMGMYQSQASTALWSDVAKMKQYDLVINSCECAEHGEEKTQAMLQNHSDYAAAGGRVFDTHYNYYWINHGPGAMPATAAFSPGMSATNTATAAIDTSFPKGQALSAWLVAVGASTTPGQLPLQQVASDVTSINSPATRWIYEASPAAVFHYTFDTPLGASPGALCGKVLFSDFHPAAGSNTQFTPFPGECTSNAMTAQEAALEFMLFDLSSCIQIDTEPPAPPPIQ